MQVDQSQKLPLPKRNEGILDDIQCNLASVSHSYGEICMGPTQEQGHQLLSDMSDVADDFAFSKG